MDLADLQLILSDVTYRDWYFEPGLFGADGYWLRVSFPVPVAVEGFGGGTFATKQAHGRKWYVSPHATRSEVIETALKAVLTAEEHEAREHFAYRGRRVFGPHLHVDSLVGLCDGGDAALERRGAG